MGRDRKAQPACRRGPRNSARLAPWIPPPTTRTSKGWFLADIAYSGAGGGTGMSSYPKLPTIWTNATGRIGTRAVQPPIATRSLSTVASSVDCERCSANSSAAISPQNRPWQGPIPHRVKCFELINIVSAVRDGGVDVLARDVLTSADCRFRRYRGNLRGPQAAEIGHRQAKTPGSGRFLVWTVAPRRFGSSR